MIQQAPSVSSLSVVSWKCITLTKELLMKSFKPIIGLCILRICHPSGLLAGKKLHLTHQQVVLTIKQVSPQPSKPTRTTTSHWRQYIFNLTRGTLRLTLHLIPPSSQILDSSQPHSRLTIRDSLPMLMLLCQ